MKKTMVTFLFCLTMVLSACTGATPMNEEPLGFVDATFEPFPTVVAFALENPYFTTVHYDEDVVILISGNYIFKFTSDGETKRIIGKLDDQDVIVFYDKENDEIYYKRLPSVIYKLNLTTLVDERANHPSGELKYIDGGLVSFSGDTIIYDYLTGSTLYDNYLKAYGFYDPTGYRYGIYQNLGKTCSVKLLLNKTVLAEADLDSICTEIVHFGADHVVFQNRYTYDVANSTLRNKYSRVDATGNVSYFEIPNYENHLEVTWLDDYFMVKYEWNEGVWPRYRFFRYDDFTEFSLLGTPLDFSSLLAMTETYFFGYDMVGNLLRIRRTDNATLSTYPGVTGWNNLKIVVYDEEYLVYDPELSPMVDGALYRMDGSVILENLAYYQPLNEGLSLYLIKNGQDRYEAYYFDMTTYLSTQISGLSLTDLNPVYIFEDCVGFNTNAQVLLAEYPNRDVIDFYDFEGKYLDTYTRLSHTRYACYVNSAGKVFFAK